MVARALDEARWERWVAARHRCVSWRTRTRVVCGRVPFVAVGIAFDDHCAGSSGSACSDGQDASGVADPRLAGRWR